MIHIILPPTPHFSCTTTKQPNRVFAMFVWISDVLSNILLLLHTSSIVYVLSTIHKSYVMLCRLAENSVCYDKLFYIFFIKVYCKLIIFLRFLFPVFLSSLLFQTDSFHSMIFFTTLDIPLLLVLLFFLFLLSIWKKHNTHTHMRSNITLPAIY